MTIMVSNGWLGVLLVAAVGIAAFPYFAVREYGFVPQARQTHHVEPFLWYELQYPFNLHLVPVLAFAALARAPVHRAVYFAVLAFHGFHQWFHVPYIFMEVQGGCFVEQDGVVCFTTKLHMVIGTMLFSYVVSLVPHAWKVDGKLLEAATWHANHRLFVLWYLNALLCAPAFWETAFNRGLYVSWALMWGLSVAFAAAWFMPARLANPPDEAYQTLV